MHHLVRKLMVKLKIAKIGHTPHKCVNCERFDNPRSYEQGGKLVLHTKEIKLELLIKVRDMQ